MKRTFALVKRSLILMMAICLLFGDLAYSQTLSKGDIAFIGYIASTTDGFTIIALNPLPAGEQIFLTDRGWAGSSYGWMYTQLSECYLKYTVPAGGHACGTILTFIET